MKLQEAKEECERWLSYLDRQRENSKTMQRIAKQVRSKEITSEEGQRLVRNLDGSGIKVYDAARLEQAVKLLLKKLEER